MKKKTNRDLIILILLIPLLLLGAFFISRRAEGLLPAYSVMNKSFTGCSIFFEALKELDFPVSRSLEPLGGIETDTIQIIAENKDFDVNREEIITWVESGGILVYLTVNGTNPILSDASPEARDNLNIYKYGSGQIVELKASDLANSALIKDAGPAYSLVEKLSALPGNEISFNEFYMYSGLNQKSLWSQTPAEVKFILYQLVIVLAAWFYYRGKRFGKVIPLYEEAERSENEYLYSVAALYRHAGCYDLILENYYRHFLSELKCTHENWLECWEKEAYPKWDLAKLVYEFMHQPLEKNPGSKKYLQIITALEQLGKYTKKGVKAIGNPR